jgi:hypothetical protein
LMRRKDLERQLLAGLQERVLGDWCEQAGTSARFR